MVESLKTCQVGNCNRPATGTYQYEAIDCDRDDVEVYEIPACDLHRDPTPDDDWFWFYDDTDDLEQDECWDDEIDDWDSDYAAEWE